MASSLFQDGNQLAIPQHRYPFRNGQYLIELVADKHHRNSLSLQILYHLQQPIDLPLVRADVGSSRMRKRVSRVSARQMAVICWLATDRFPTSSSRGRSAWTSSPPLGRQFPDLPPVDQPILGLNQLAVGDILRYRQVGKQSKILIDHLIPRFRD